MVAVYSRCMEKKKLLIVDDDSGLRKALERCFRLDGLYDVRGAENGNDALKAIREGYKPHVVLSDFDMPECNGAALYKALCEEFPSVSCHVILMSGGTKAAKFADQKSLPYLDKPFSNDEVLKVVGSLMEVVDEA